MTAKHTMALIRTGLFSTYLVSLLWACSGSNFRGNSKSTDNGSSDAVAGDTISTTPISSTDLAIPAALKAGPDALFAQYPTVMLKNGTTQFTLDPKEVSTTVALKDEVSNKTEKFVQNTRTATSDMFKQGSPGEEKTDNFTQNGKKGQVDILLVIDNSPSMEQEQLNLSTKLNELLVAIKDADWQIGVITTNTAINGDVNVDGHNDPNSEGKESCFLSLIRKGDAKAADDFAKAVTAGITGSGYEQGIRQAVVGLRCPGKTVVRPGATLAVLIVSDEDNCSADGFDCRINQGQTALPWSRETYLINYVENTLKKQVGKDAGFYGIVAPSRNECPTAFNIGVQYIRLFNYKATPASNYGNICDASYKTTLNRISSNIALLLDDTFTLSNTPDGGTVSVSVTAAGVTTVVDPNDYTLTGTALTFKPGKTPANGSKIAVKYRINSRPLFNSVTLANDPAAGTIVVSINGMPLGAGTFASNGRVISFGSQPAANANIKVDYRINSPLANSFQLVGSPLAGTVTVKVKNAAYNNFTYDPNTKQVKLGSFPLDAEPIDISYDSIDGPKLTYTVSIGAMAKNFRLLDGTTPVPFTLDPATSAITIDKTYHKAGKTLLFVYEMPTNSERRFPLQGKPEEGSLALNIMGGSCTLDKELKIVGTELVSTCPVAEKTDFVLSYKYKAPQKTFTLSGITDPEKGTWQVYYNGQPTQDYTRTEATITLNFEPDLTSRVDVYYRFPE